MLVYDITSLKSFESLDSWKQEFQVHAEPDEPEQFPIVVIGNKCDKMENRMVKKGDAEDWCKFNGNLQYFEASAKDSTNIINAFECILRKTISAPKKEIGTLQVKQSYAPHSPVKSNFKILLSGSKIMVKKYASLDESGLHHASNFAMTINGGKIVCVGNNVVQYKKGDEILFSSETKNSFRIGGEFNEFCIIDLEDILGSIKN